MQGTGTLKGSTEMKRAESGHEDHDVLYGWKAIAAFIGCSARNAQRMEKNEGLPVLRPDKRRKWRALALRRSLEAWMTGGVESAAVTGNSLHAFDRRMHILWSHEFPKPLHNYAADELEWRLQIVDLDGSGERGVLFVARYLTHNNPDTLFYFSPNG
jgi:hypothetical protein